ncbi:tripartite tricarboxylate transporter TctB family protein [Pandoraea pnomenusa]|uniref:tripartite tricarboxylate transporter TctB family protein n=1 Tax=Pandoraea pnomenusa TaxID=93220 RepID=UPI00334063BD
MKATFNRDHFGGGLMLVAGLAVVMIGRNYEVGSLRSMGPGFFPVMLGVVLALIGIAIAAGAKPVQEAADESGSHPEFKPEWRGWICIILSVVAFVVLGEYFGFIPAVFAVVLISALGDRENTIGRVVLLSLAATVFGVIVFSWLLKVQMPLLVWGH